MAGRPRKPNKGGRKVNAQPGTPPPGSSSEDFSDLLGEDRPQLPVLTAEAYQTDLTLWADPATMVKWLKQTAHMPVDAAALAMAEHSYAAMSWRFRQAALAGDYNGTRALQLWLQWADGVLGSAPKGKEVAKPNPAAAAFAPREVKKADAE